MGTQLLFLISVFATLVAAEFNFTDIPGVYKKVAGNIQKCWPSITFFKSTRRIHPSDLIMDIANCTDGSIGLKLKPGLRVKEFPPRFRRHMGTILQTVESRNCSRTLFFICGGRNLQFCKSHFFRTDRDAEFKVPGVGPVLHIRNMRYFTLYDKTGACVYEAEANMALIPSPVPSAPDSTAPLSKEPQSLRPPPPLTNNESRSIWIWLGPVIGALSTVGAALIGIKCMYQGKENERRKHAIDLLNLDS